MLKGLEDAWYTVTDPNSVTFRNVPPGDYHFMVKNPYQEPGMVG